MGGLKNIDDVDQFESMLSEATGLVVVHFTASWSGPSKLIGPKFEELSKLEENAGVVFAQLDVADVTADEEVRFIPTFKFYKNGEEVAEVMGLGADLATITALLAEHT